MTHEELVLRAVRWLRTTGCSPVYAEMTTAASETPDAIGWKNGYSKVVECKVSRGDFFADRKKPHCFDERCGIGYERWYLTPRDLVKPEEVPEWCGLLYALPRQIRIAKKAPPRPNLNAIPHREEVSILLSALRRIELGSQFDRATGKWESYLDRIHRQKSGSE